MTLPPEPVPEVLPDAEVPLEPDPDVEPEVAPELELVGVLLPFDEPHATTPNMAETIAVATTARDFLVLILSPFS